MDVKFADTFLPSLKKLINRQRWYWRVYDTMRYDLPRFIRTFYKHRMDLWNSRPWDSVGSLRFMKTHLTVLANHLEKYGHEVEESKKKRSKEFAEQ